MSWLYSTVRQNMRFLFGSVLQKNQLIQFQNCHSSVYEKFTKKAMCCFENHSMVDKLLNSILPDSWVWPLHRIPHLAAAGASFL